MKRLDRPEQLERSILSKQLIYSGDPKKAPDKNDLHTVSGSEPRIWTALEIIAFGKKGGIIHESMRCADDNGMHKMETCELCGSG